MNVIKSLVKNKEAKNAGWLIGGRIVQMLISLIVGVLTARYLGPGNYGLVNYGSAYVSFFSSLCTLGINSIIVKDFVDYPEEQGVTIGSTLIARAASSFLSAIMIVSVSSIVDSEEPITIAVVALCSIALLFQVFDTFNYWFQYRYQSKVTAIAILVAYIVTAVYRIVLLLLGAKVQSFALASSVDYVVLGLFYFIAYKKSGGPALKFSWAKTKSLLGNSYHYILSGMMVAIYGQTDKFMLKQMLNETYVGYYSTATAICSMWVFVLSAVIDSMNPTIMRLYKTDYEQYEKKNKQLYAIVFYVSIFVSVLFLIFGDLAIRILYGEEYAPAGLPLKIITWYTAFSYLGVARNAWIVCEGKQKYLKYMYLSAAIINVLLNFVFIPILGASGAALASLITQVCTCIILPLFFKEMRRNSVLMLQAIMLKGIK